MGDASEALIWPFLMDAGGMHDNSKPSTLQADGGPNMFSIPAALPTYDEALVCAMSFRAFLIMLENSPPFCAVSASFS